VSDGPRLKIRNAEVAECDTLSALCIRSKAHWGYDDAFMDASREALTVSPDMVRENRVWVAEDRGEILGVAALEPVEPGTVELALLFVEPGAMGRGVGRLLFRHAVHMAAARGARRMEILADPGAVPFYERMGARKRGTRPSDAIPGRRLPFLGMNLR
jgi:GNAT superfamily N-acetyltransferase